jgi:glycosyltransferase involved in cell wall biosynthesis
VTGAAAAQTTIVLPVWDEYVAPSLAEALSSLAAQDVPTRILVVDNASAVALPPLPGITVVRSRRRLTLGAARNLGLHHVHTPYVVVWDADDVMLPGTVAFLEAAIASDPGLVAFGAAIVEDPSGDRHRWPRRWIARLVRAPRLFALLDCVWSLYPTTGSTIMRTELVRAAGGYSDMEAAEDWGLGVALAFRGRIGWSERSGRVYRLHHRSVWAQNMTARHQLRHARAVRERIRADRGISSWVRRAVLPIGLAQHAALAAHLAVAAARVRR